MPNGHGGAPFLGGPILFAGAFAILVRSVPASRFGWVWVVICLILAALAGWRLAYHLHMRDADSYGGAYTSPDSYRLAKRRYRMLAALYAIVAAALGFGILWWRGLPGIST